MYKKEKDYCKKWISLLEKIENDSALKERCKAYSAYVPTDDEKLAADIEFGKFLEEGYESGIVISDYRSVIEDEEAVFKASEEFINSLSEKGIIACIAWHFRRDHFCEGSLINESFTDGSLLKLFKALLNKLLTPVSQNFSSLK